MAGRNREEMQDVTLLGNQGVKYPLTMRLRYWRALIISTRTAIIL